MKPVDFDYVQPDSVEQALRLLADDPDAKVLAGGQSLLPVLNLRLARPSQVVDVGRLLELDRVFDDDDSVLVGALVRHSRLQSDPLIRRRLPLLSAAAGHIGHVAIRNRGTIGGSVAHADPAAELPAVMVALGATIYGESAGAPRRELPAENFFTSYFSTQLQPDELLTWLRVPAMRPRSGWGFVEFARRAGDFALMAAAGTVELDEQLKIADVRVVLVAAAEVPLVVSVPDDVRGERPTEALWRQCARTWAAAVTSGDDLEHRRDLAAAATRRALIAATRRAEVSHG